MTQVHPEIIGVILAAGKGSRMAAKKKNKTTLDFNGQPLLYYGLDLFSQTTDQIVVVKGAFGRSVDQAIEEYSTTKPIEVVEQRKRLGTGHAVLVADRYLAKNKIEPKYVCVGYGDHLMFYTPQSIKAMIEALENKKAAMAMITAQFDDPTGLGRVLTNEEGRVEAIIEEKDATAEQKKIKYINAGLYCFEYKFLHRFLPKIEKSPVTGEYYLTDLPALAKQNGLKVWAVEVPFQEVGIGVNTKEEMVTSQQLHSQTKSH